MLFVPTALLVTLAALQAPGAQQEPLPAGPATDEQPSNSDTAPPPQNPGAPPQSLPAAPQSSVTIEPPPDPLPHMKWDAPVLCAYLVPTKSVPSGEFRLQCDDAKHVCLVSATREIDEDGVETKEMLARTQSCNYTSVDFSRRAEKGWRFIPAVAETPPGWYRDDRGRVMQFNFDLNRRVYIGGAWSPLYSPEQGGFSNRYRAEFGSEIEFPDDERETLFRIHILEGEFFLGSENAGQFSAFKYDWSHTNAQPIARISTFIGKPARFDLDINLAGYLEALRLDTIRRAGVTETNLMLGTAQPTFDLWHSKDLVNYFRVRAGPGVNLDTKREAISLMLQAAVEGDFTIDADGFHHLRLSAEGEKFFFTGDVPLRPADPARLRLKAEYEVIFIAINDQPLSLVLDGRGGWREDIAGVPSSWEWAADAGLRFSLWAPARRSAPFLDHL